MSCDGPRFLACTLPESQRVSLPWIKALPSNRIQEAVPGVNVSV
jgi:hypothetical protein